jgi:hypothetical protein
LVIEEATMRRLHVAAWGIGFAALAIGTSVVAIAQSPLTPLDISVRKQKSGTAYLITVTPQGSALASQERRQFRVDLTDLVSAGVTIREIHAPAPWECKAALPLRGPEIFTCTFLAPVGTTFPANQRLPQIRVVYSGQATPNTSKNCVFAQLFNNASGAFLPVPDPFAVNNYSCI